MNHKDKNSSSFPAGARTQLQTWIDLAVQKAGSTRALAEALDWQQAQISRARTSDDAVSPYRASRLGEYIGLEPRLGMALALLIGARTENERTHWLAVLRPLYDELEPLNPSDYPDVISKGSRLLDAVREGFELPTDEALAAILHISEADIAAVRAGEPLTIPQRLRIFERLPSIRFRQFLEGLLPHKAAVALKETTVKSVQREADKIIKRRRSTE
jgi:plasmid maintenance system antidote protein VapI